MKFKDLFLKGDRYIWFSILIFTIFSLFTVFSSTTYLINKSGGDYFSPVFGHLTYQLFSIAVIAFMQHMNYKNITMLGVFLVCISIVSLLCIHFGFGTRSNGATRWIDILGVPIQPSEFAKVAVIIVTAFTLSRGQSQGGVDWQSMSILGVVIGLIMGLIFPHNLSTVVIMTVVVFIMMFVGRVQKRILFGIAGLGIAVGSLIFFYNSLPDAVQSVLPERMVTWNARINRMNADENIESKGIIITDENRQESYSKMAIVRGGAWGVGIGNNKARDFLSESYSDYIFAVIFEECGFWGPIIIMIAYLILLWRIVMIALRCKQTYPMFLVLGCGTMLLFQAAVHMAVTVDFGGIVTGQPLPFISRGGSSLMGTALLLGIILCVDVSERDGRIGKRSVMREMSIPETEHLSN